MKKGNKKNRWMWLFKYYNKCWKSFIYELILVNVRKWEVVFKNDEKELEKVKNDEVRYMKVRIYVFFILKI